MDGYHKIAVKNVSAVDICFRKEGLLYNEGRIVVDVETYDFAGHITDDVIVGFYRNGIYYIHYYYMTYIFDINPITGISENPMYQYEEYEIQLKVEFERTTIPNDFTKKILKFGKDKYSLTFEQIVPDVRQINEVVNNNLDLIMPRS